MILVKNHFLATLPCVLLMKLYIDGLSRGGNFFIYLLKGNYLERLFMSTLIDCQGIRTSTSVGLNILISFHSIFKIYKFNFINF